MAGSDDWFVFFLNRASLYLPSTANCQGCQSCQVNNNDLHTGLAHDTCITHINLSMLLPWTGVCIVLISQTISPYETETHTHNEKVYVQRAVNPYAVTMI